MSILNTGEGDAFVASADRRDTSPEIMEAIAFFARTIAEAEMVCDAANEED